MFIIFVFPLSAEREAKVTQREDKINDYHTTVLMSTNVFST